MATGGYRGPEFLSDEDKPIHRLRCPIHGFIHYSPNERQVIDHPLFQRLRFIRQLALTEYVYPGATHTRFEHSLGVMEVATRIFDSLAAKKGDDLEKVVATVPHYSEQTLARARQTLRLAALLHDVGHAPFSHAAEPILHEGANHERISIQAMRERSLLGGLLDKLWGTDTGKAVAELYEGGDLMGSQLDALHDIVAGEMDADRTDYLLRDAHHCGVDYGRFDHRRLIECLDLREAGGGLEIALQRDGIHAFEALILARYQMNTQVYYHRVRRIYDHYLQRYFEALGRQEKWDVDRILSEHDTSMLSRIFADQLGDGPQAEFAKRICNRRHHRMVHKTGDDANAHDLRRAIEVCDELKGQFPETDVIFDKATGKIHKLLVPDDQDDTGLVNLMLLHGRSERPIGEESQVLRRIDRLFQCARIFADVPPGPSELRDSMTDFADQAWQRRGGH